MRAKYIYILLTMLILALVLGCERPPLEEMERAREAVFRAENDADAVQYAGSTLSRAQNALRLMLTEAESKRYDTAGIHAAEAIAAAERAIAEGRAAASRIREEAASIITSLRTEIEETGRNINGARYSLMDLDYESLEDRLRNAWYITDQAQDDYAAGRYQSALDRARAVRADLFEINQMISNAVTRGK